MKDYTLEDVKTIIEKSLNLDATGDDFIDTRFENHNTKFGHYWHYYRTFYLLAKELNPGLVVELGGWQGTAASHFASGNSGTTVMTIDHHGDPGDDLNKQLMLAASTKYDNLIYFQNWTWDALPKVKMYAKYIDILFIDSWHDYEHAMKDWNDYRPLLTDGALVICDDIIGGYGPVISGMLDFWEELDYEKFLNSQIHPGSNVGFFKYVD